MQVKNDRNSCDFYFFTPKEQSIQISNNNNCMHSEMTSVGLNIWLFELNYTVILFSIFRYYVSVLFISFVLFASMLHSLCISSFPLIFSVCFSFLNFRSTSEDGCDCTQRLQIVIVRVSCRLLPEMG